MGVNLTPIMVKQELSLKDLQGKSFAVDASNYLYQFLSLVRTRDGTPLQDSSGRITSHLAGLLFRSTRLIRDFGIDLVFVFDGLPPTLKEVVIKKRRRQREKAFREWQRAREAGDMAAAFSKAVMTSRLSRSMIEDAKQLLRLLGIPFVQAPSEAEAQAAYMASKTDVWGVSSKDYDALLFGAPRLLRFLTIHGREYLPSKRMTRPLVPELINLERFLLQHGISREQLVDLAILVGTDFNPGVRGVGSKTALKLVKKHGKIENLSTEYLSKVSPRYQEVREIFLNPKITNQYETSYGPLKEEELFNFLSERDFARERVETAVNRMREFYKLKKQANLKKWLD